MRIPTTIRVNPISRLSFDWAYTSAEEKQGYILTLADGYNNSHTPHAIAAIPTTM